jgi:hypothetical protein
MAGYQAENKRVIEKAFRRLQTSQATNAREGMIRVAKEGMQYLLDIHSSEPDAWRHPSEDNTIAYAVAYNGAIVAAEHHNGDPNLRIKSSAMEEAMRLLSGTTGWVAIILSDMEEWYRADWEESFIRYSADRIRADFQRIFKTIRR